MWWSSSAGVRTSDSFDEVDGEMLQYLRLDEVADADLGHDRDVHGVLDGLDHAGMRHA